MLRRGLDQLATLVAGVRPEAAGDPTPCTDWTVRAWDLHQNSVGESLRLIHRSPVDCVAVSPDGRRALTGCWQSPDNLVHLWDLRRIRHRLAAIKLDWDLPPLPPPQGDAGLPLRVDVELGDLAPVREAGR